MERRDARTQEPERREMSQNGNDSPGVGRLIGSNRPPAAGPDLRRDQPPVAVA